MSIDTPLDSAPRILCIEDDEALARVIRIRLTRLGYHVEVVPDGNDGLAILKANGCDLALLDYKLPGMDGLMVMRELSKEKRFPPVVMLSGAGDLNVAVEAMKLGASDYMIKEVDRSYFDLLESTIERCLAKQRLENEKRQAEAFLSQRSDQLKTTLTNIEEGLCVFDADMKLVIFNDQWLNLYGYPKEMAVVGADLHTFLGFRYDRGEFGEIPKVQALDGEIARLSCETSDFFEIKRPNGKTIEVRSNPMPNGGFVATHTDITQRKQHEEKIRENEERYRRLSEFASSVIHNVGNILSSINVSTSTIIRHVRESKQKQLGKVVKMLQNGAAEPGFLSENERGKLLPSYLESLARVLNEEFGDIEAESQSMLKNLMLITQIIEYQQSQGRHEDSNDLVDLRQVVEDALNVKMDAIMRDNIRVHTEFDSLSVSSQKAKLTHVLINLVKNAIEAMVPVAEEDRALTIWSGMHEEGGIFLSIRDTGIGLNDEQMANLFSHGFTTKTNGHGFGLHYCLGTMEEMGSRIWAQSDGEGKGATFTLYFPEGA